MLHVDQMQELFKYAFSIAHIAVKVLEFHCIVLQIRYSGKPSGCDIQN